MSDSIVNDIGRRVSMPVIRPEVGQGARERLPVPDGREEFQSHRVRPLAPPARVDEKGTIVDLYA